MTEKRYGMSNETGAFIDKQLNKEYTDDEIIDLLNEQHKRIEYLENLPSERLELLKQAKIKEIDLKEENEQLKQRNTRQAKQLDRLYCLIEEKDWRALNDILDDFKRCEEQLRKEWGTYGDLND